MRTRITDIEVTEWKHGKTDVKVRRVRYNPETRDFTAKYRSYLVSKEKGESVLKALDQNKEVITTHKTTVTGRYLLSSDFGY